MKERITKSFSEDSAVTCIWTNLPKDRAAEDVQHILPGHHLHRRRHVVSVTCPLEDGLLTHKLSFSFDISSMSAIIRTDQYVDYFNDPHGIVQGAIGSALAAGYIVGALFAGLCPTRSVDEMQFFQPVFGGLPVQQYRLLAMATVCLSRVVSSTGYVSVLLRHKFRFSWPKLPRKKSKVRCW